MKIYDKLIELFRANSKTVEIFDYKKDEEPSKGIYLDMYRPFDVEKGSGVLVRYRTILDINEHRVHIIMYENNFDIRDYSWTIVDTIIDEEINIEDIYFSKFLLLYTDIVEVQNKEKNTKRSGIFNDFISDKLDNKNPIDVLVEKRYKELQNARQSENSPSSLQQDEPDLMNFGDYEDVEFDENI